MGEDGTCSAVTTDPENVDKLENQNPLGEIRKVRYVMNSSSMEEFYSVSFEDIEKVIGKAPKLWMCGSSCIEEDLGQVIVKQDLRDDAYVPMPFPKDQLEQQEWFHALLWDFYPH